MTGLKKTRRNAKRKTHRNLRKNTRRRRNNNKTKQRIFYGKGQGSSVPPPPKPREPTDEENDDSFMRDVWYNANYYILGDEMEEYKNHAASIEKRREMEKKKPGSGYNPDGSYKN